MNRRGMTVVELLVAAAILLTILSIVGGNLLSTRRGYEANKEVATAAGQLRAAIERLQYDLSLAGFCGMQDACTFGSSPVQVQTSSGGSGLRIIESITSTYRENRFTGGGEVQREVTYRVENGKLLRSSSGEGEIAIADGISQLVLVGYRNRKGPTAATMSQRPPADELGGIVLRLDYVQRDSTESEEFTVPLRNSQVVGGV